MATELTTEQTLEEAITAHRAGNLQDAERQYRAILQSEPQNPDANHNLGVLAVSLNQAKHALPLFKTALQTNPNKVQFWLSYIDALIKTNQFEEAKRVLSQGKKVGLAGEKLDALEVQLNPNNLNQGSVPLSKKQAPTFAQQLKQAAAKKRKEKKSSTKQTNTNQIRSPSQSDINLLLDHYQTGQYEHAENLAKTITQSYPGHPFAWKVLAAVFQQTGRVQESLIPNQKAVELSSEDAEAHSNLGNTLHELGRSKEAEACYLNALALKPNFAEAHYSLGNTLHKLGRLQEAEASYITALTLKPEYANAHCNLGNTLHELTKFKEAEAQRKADWYQRNREKVIARVLENRAKKVKGNSRTV
jgi:tetratricopeptide (TPR) repeat protein